ncbi:MAG TPA: PQQ-binding-like beta-propeller repeat protein [Chthoniobacteraceae bacterium]|nr:PQQ-binding-like beta-propeller repeat protein [Chthoniobacteraceae bacterium]
MHSSRLLAFPVVVSFGICLAVSISAHAQEWTRFRGPNGSGLGNAPNFPAKFSETDFNWKIALPGSGHSSPVLWGNRIFITCVPPSTAKRIALCIDARDGKIVWERSYESTAFRQHADNSYASMSPAVDSERVYIWWGAPEGSSLVALDQKDGREVWKKDLGSFVSQHGPGASPIVFENTVILHFDQDQPTSFLAAFDAKTGAQRWKLTRPGTSSTASTPCILQTAAGPQIVAISRTAGLIAVEAKTGALQWEIPDLLSKRCVASPIVTPGGLIIAQCGEGRAESFVYAVRPPHDGKPPEKVYEVVRTGGYVPTPIAVGEYLFLWKEDGLVTCLRSGTNEQIWSERVQGPFYSSPVCVNNHLYNLTRKGDLVVLKAGDKFEEVARIPLGEGSHATPAVAGGRMFLRTFSHLISVGK